MALDTHDAIVKFYESHIFGEKTKRLCFCMCVYVSVCGRLLTIQIVGKFFISCPNEFTDSLFCLFSFFRFSFPFHCSDGVQCFDASQAELNYYRHPGQAMLAPPGKNNSITLFFFSK